MIRMPPGIRTQLLTKLEAPKPSIDSDALLDTFFYTGNVKAVEWMTAFVTTRLDRLDD